MADIKLKNKQGVEKVRRGVRTLTVPNADGVGTTTYEAASAPISKYVTFTAEQAGSTIRLNKSSSVLDWVFEYSTDNVTWFNYAVTTSSRTITLAKVGDFVSFRGVHNYTRSSHTSSNYYTFVMTGRIAASGDCGALMDAVHSDIMTPYCFYHLFNGCTSLTTAPELPATTLAHYCYSVMFQGCTSLTTAPELPATTLANYCYQGMFQYCTSLTTAPELPATTLAQNCYITMFQGCTSLTTAPELPATTLATSCYYYMFYGCTSLTTAPELPATTLAQQCYFDMFNGCTSLTTAPELPATTLATSCYHGMFYRCSSIKFSETQTGEYQYPYRIPTEGTGTTATDATLVMFVGTGGTFKSDPAINTTYYTTHEPV